MKPYEAYRKAISLYKNEGITSEVVALMVEAGNGEHGNALAFLGFIHQEGQYVERDLNKAIAYYERSAKQQCGLGLYNLGSAYNNGYGVARDEERAFEFFMKAADVGYDEGLNTVGDFYFNGIVVSRDYETAVRYFKEAFAVGNFEAGFRLGHCLDYGQGITADSDRAAALYYIAAKMGVRAAEARAMCAMPTREALETVTKGNAELLAASFTGDIRRIMELVRYGGVDVDSPVNPDGDTLLTRSIMHGHTAIAQQVISMGADVNIPLHNGRTALMTAVGLGDVEMTRTLLNAGAKINWVKSGGNTALMYAISKNQSETARMLLDAGADQAMKDDEDMDAMAYARSFAPNLVRLFG